MAVPSPPIFWKYVYWSAQRELALSARDGLPLISWDFKSCPFFVRDHYSASEFAAVPCQSRLVSSLPPLFFSIRLNTEIRIESASESASQRNSRVFQHAAVVVEPLLDVNDFAASIWTKGGDKKMRPRAGVAATRLARLPFEFRLPIPVPTHAPALGMSARRVTLRSRPALSTTTTTHVITTDAARHTRFPSIASRVLHSVPHA